MKKLVIGSVFILVALCGCDSTISPADTIELYLHSFEAKDTNKLSNLSCAEYAEQSQLMLDSFVSVELEITDLECIELENDGSNALVNCTGSIVASYNDENQILDLSYTNYILNKIHGEWLVCGQK